MGASYILKGNFGQNYNARPIEKAPLALITVHSIYTGQMLWTTTAPLVMHMHEC